MTLSAPAPRPPAARPGVAVASVAGALLLHWIAMTGWHSAPHSSAAAASGSILHISLVRPGQQTVPAKPTAEVQQNERAMQHEPARAIAAAPMSDDSADPGPIAQETPSPQPPAARHNREEFWTEQELAVRPQPLESALPLDWSPPTEGGTPYRVALLVYVDEFGRVPMVRAQGDDVPAALQEALDRTFENARFRPGFADGSAVKAVVTMEAAIEDHRLLLRADRPG